MPRTTRRHGTRSSYNLGCHCPECTTANREYMREHYRLGKPYAPKKFDEVDPARAVAHIERLRAEGMGYGAIAEAAGMLKNSVREVAIGARTRGIRAETEQRILAVKFDPEWVDATGTRRRIQALAALGHTFPDIATRTGIVHRTLSAIVCGQSTVYKATAARVTAVYDSLSMVPGPSDLARTRAHTKGWAVPLAWDEDTIDDPNAEPVGMRVGRGRGEYEFDLDEWFWLVRIGENPQRAADRCGVKLGSVDWRARRAGRGAEYVAAMERSRERHVA